MKILVLGDSASSGKPTGGRSFAHVFRDYVAEESGQAVDLHHSTFIATGDQAPSYARSLVEEHKPDLVMLVIGEYLYTAGFVWLRVKRLFGDRAGNWFRQREQGFDASTNKPGRFRPRLNGMVRRVARSVIGAETITTWEEAAEATDGTLRELAKFEELEVLVVAHPILKGFIKEGKPTRDRAAHRVAVRAAAGRHRFPFLDTTDAFEADAEFLRARPNDALHGTMAQQEAMGSFIFQKYREEHPVLPSS